jgi:hypothetical protein
MCTKNKCKILFLAHKILFSAARFCSQPARFCFQLTSFRFRLSSMLIIGHLSTLGVIWCNAKRPDLVVKDDDELTEFASWIFLAIYAQICSGLLTTAGFLTSMEKSCAVCGDKLVQFTNLEPNQMTSLASACQPNFRPWLGGARALTCTCTYSLMAPVCMGQYPYCTCLSEGSNTGQVTVFLVQVINNL